MKFSASLAATALLSTAAYAETPNVVADIAPVHSLVAQVMAGVGEPHLLIPARISPHGHALKVSEARKLSDADMVFWIGETLTPWLEKALNTLASDTEALELLEVKGLTLLVGDEEEPLDEAHHDDEHHHHGDADPHIWLDPLNAIVLTTTIAERLALIDADNAEVYRSNAEITRQRLSALSTEISTQMQPFENRKYFVFHDGYRYFENRFGLGRAIAISGSHAAKPGARRLSEIRRLLRETPTTCIFAERQFGAKSIDAIIRGSDARKAELDPMGGSLTPGPDLYDGLIRALTASFRECFK